MTSRTPSPPPSPEQPRESATPKRPRKRPRTARILLLQLLLQLPTWLTGAALADEVTRYDNGRWLDDDGTYVAGPRFVAAGVFVAEPDGAVATVVDLGGRFVVPPLADAHTHALGNGDDFERQQTRLLAAGVFYAANPNNSLSAAAAARSAVLSPDTIDATFSNGGLTSTAGHPVQIYDRAADHTPGVEREDMRGDAYFEIDDLADLERAWPQILAGRPDFLKLYLEEGEHHAERVGRDEFYGRRGLDPALLAPIVERAHAAGLRVAVHVASAFDFVTAVEAGADEIAHLPLERLDEAAAQLAAEKGTVVVTTVLSHRPSSVPDLEEVHRHNLALLERHGVEIVLGTDNELGLMTELQNVQRLLGLSNREALLLATRTTPRWVFPDRPIGALGEGHEASFLVLDEDPLLDLGALEQIHLRVKQGRPLEIEETAPEKPGIGQTLVHTVMSRGVEAAIEQYHRLRHESPDDYDFGEPQLNALGYALIQHQQLDAAIAIFELNTEIFPQASNTWDSLGEALMLAGRDEESTSSYRRSLELDPHNDNARQKLRELEEREASAAGAVPPGHQ